MSYYEELLKSITKDNEKGYKKAISSGSLHHGKGGKFESGGGSSSKENSNYKKIKEEYLASSDKNVIDFIRKYDSIKNQSYKKELDVNLGTVTNKFADYVKKLTGANVSGYQHTLFGNDLQHIRKRHGKNGINDHTMADENHIGRIGYVLANYDEIELARKQDGKVDLAYGYSDKDGKPAKKVIIKKRINGYIYIAEAITDTKKHQLRLITAYRKKHLKI